MAQGRARRGALRFCAGHQLHRSFPGFRGRGVDRVHPVPADTRRVGSLFRRLGRDVIALLSKPLSIAGWHGACRPDPIAGAMHPRWVLRGLAKPSLPNHKRRFTLLPARDARALPSTTPVWSRDDVRFYVRLCFAWASATARPASPNCGTRNSPCSRACARQLNKEPECFGLECRTLIVVGLRCWARPWYCS